MPELYDMRQHRELVPAKPERRFNAIGFVGSDYLLEFVDDYGHVYRGRGERPSLAWASIEQQMHAAHDTADATVQGRAA